MKDLILICVTALAVACAEIWYYGPPRHRYECVGEYTPSGRCTLYQLVGTP